MVDGLSSSTRNAKYIRDALLETFESDSQQKLVLIGYSKGANDILEALVAYPELRPYVAAMVSAAGAIGGFSTGGRSKRGTSFADYKMAGG